MNFITAVILSCCFVSGFIYEMEVMNDDGIEGIIQDYLNVREDKRASFIFATCGQIVLMGFLWIPVEVMNFITSSLFKDI